MVPAPGTKVQRGRHLRSDRGMDCIDVLTVLHTHTLQTAWGRRGAGGGVPRPSPLRWAAWYGVRTPSELHGAVALVGSDGEVPLLPDREQPRRRLLMHRAMDTRRI